MYQSINFGAVNVDIDDLAEMICLAKKFGFEGVEASPAQVIALGADKTNELLNESEIKISCFNLPVHPISCTDEEHYKALSELPKQAEIMQNVGCTRTITWLLSGNNTMDYSENFSFHVKRISPVAKILKEYGISLGLEFLGPVSIRKNFKYEFIYTAEKMFELAEACGDNCGLLFDVWHWYMGANNRDVFKNIGLAKNIVNVHVNDSPKGNRDEMPDSPRALPAETGIIDIGFVMECLRGTGYSGPVVSEPFSSTLAGMDDDYAKISLVKKQMDSIWPK